MSIRQATSSVGLGPQVVEVDVAVGVGADLDHLVAGHRHRRRVGAVRGVGRQHLGALLAAILVVGAGEQHPGELAVGAGGGLQRDVRQPGDLRQRVLQAPHQLERALGALGSLERMQLGVPGQRGDAARGAWGCASSCTSRADRSRCRGRSCAWTGGCSGGRSRARRPRAGAAARLRRSAGAAARRAGARARRARGRRTPAARAGSARRSSARRRRRRCSTAHAPTSCGTRPRSAATASPSTSASRSISARVRRSVIATSSPSPSSG